MRNNNKKFYPNSNWLYIKIYCGYKTAEKILANEVFNFVNENQNTFEKFFFIRYFDEFPHFRVRFYNSFPKKNIELQYNFITSLQSHLDTDLVHKVTVDTYQREIERYGENLIENTETLFYYDSICSIKLLNLFSQIEEPEKYRLLISLRSIHELLNDFNLSLDQKYECTKILQSSFFIEFGAHPKLQKQLNDKYRNYQKLIFSHLDNNQDNSNEIEEAIELLNIRSTAIKPIVDIISSNVSSDLKLYNLLASYIHMLMNRMFISQQRKYELVLYHFLEKYYNSQLAIKKYSV